MSGEDVVGPRGDRHQRGIEPTLGNIAVGAVAAQHDQRVDAFLGETLRQCGGVASNAVDRFVEHVDRDIAGLAVMKIGHRPLAETMTIRRDDDAIRPSTDRAEYGTTNDADLCRVRSRRRMRHQATDILARRGIGDDADGAGSTGHDRRSASWRGAAEHGTDTRGDARCVGHVVHLQSR